MDITSTLAPKSDQLNTDDLITGPKTISITKVTAGNADQPVAIYFDGDNGKPWFPCKSMRRVLVAAWGAEASHYVGRRVTLFRDPEVTYGGIKVGGIRISHLSELDNPLSIALTVTRQKRTPYRVEPLAALPVAKEPTIEELAAAAQLACDAAGLTPAGMVDMIEELGNGKATTLAELPANILVRLAKSGISFESVTKFNAAGELLTVAPADDPDDLPATWTETD